MLNGLARQMHGRLRPLGHLLSVQWRAWVYRVGAAPSSSAPEKPWPGSATRAGAALSTDDLALIRADLRHMLNHHVLARRVLRHLAFVEHALGARGARAFDHLPLPAIRCALDQLEAFVDDWTPRGLAELRLRLTFALIKRAKTWSPEGRDAVLSAFWVDSRLQVKDASLSAFDNAAMSWTAPSSP